MGAMQPFDISGNRLMAFGCGAATESIFGRRIILPALAALIALMAFGNRPWPFSLKMEGIVNILIDIQDVRLYASGLK